jgi:hypothetical protein
MGRATMSNPGESSTAMEAGKGAVAGLVAGAGTVGMFQGGLAAIGFGGQGVVGGTLNPFRCPF